MEAGILIREAGPDVIIQHAFPLAVVDFPQARIRDRVQCECFCENAGSIEGAFEVAGIDSFDHGAPQPFSQLSGLADSISVERNILLALVSLFVFQSCARGG